jgi:diguanylate cyclase (GGDEF)-like protein
MRVPKTHGGMNEARRFGWGMAASVAAVMALVFAALVSSWFGLEAEARGRETTSRAAELERDVAEARAQAATLAALQAEVALDALRRESLGPRSARAVDYESALQALRTRLSRIGAGVLEPGERELLAFASGSVERFADLHRGSGAAPGARLDGARPLVDRALAQIAALERSVAARSAEAARDADAASRIARALLIAFGGMSLLLALVLARSLSESMARRTELVGELERLARLDGLTGVGNRRVWDDELARGLERARRTAKRCSVALVDLDHFKRYNDTYGHQRGDALLRAAAQAFATRLRGDDLVARYGGEEFAVLLHGCDLDNAITLFERMQDMLPGGQTFSAGIADSDGRDDPAQVLARADAALYRAKALGRNRTVGAPAA